VDQQGDFSPVYFLLADAYRRGLAARGCLREAQGYRGFSCSERHLQCIWFDASLRPANLMTQAGEPVTVISPGRWNLEAGPDFLDAVLRIGGADSRQLQGDIEIHIQPRDWEHHGHGRDPRYRRVIGHVTYHPVTATPVDLPPCTVEIALRAALAANPAFSMDAVDLSAYPYAASAGDCPCAAMVATWSPEQVAAMLEAAGAFRLEQKAARFAERLRHETPDTLLYQETMVSLGYKQNSGPFRLLAERIPLDALAKAGSPLAAYALLLGVSGLMPETPSPRWSAETRGFLRAVWDCWWPMQERWGGSSLPPKAWTLSGLRPQNHPIRRLAAAATLFAGHSESLLERILAILRQTGDTKPLTAMFAPPAPLDHWLYTLSLGSVRQTRPVALVGDDRRAAWCSNVVLPLLAATGIEITPWLSTLPPEATNSMMSQMAHRLLGRDHNPSLYAKHGLRQQGLQQIFHDYCLAERAGCQTCTFAQAMNQN